MTSIKKVRCIDAAGTSGLLKAGAIYEVRSEVGRYYELTIGGPPWYQNRFEDVQEPITILDLPLPTHNITTALPHSTPASETIDREEERLRALLRPTILADECACGIKKVMCAYHKG